MTRNYAACGGGRTYQSVVCVILLICTWGLHGQSHAAGTCESWVGKIVSLQGQVEVIRTGKARWQRVSLEETFCPGDRVRIEARSRAAIFMRNETVLRLEAGTTITFEESEPDKPSLLEILKGAVHFISRVPRTLKIKTPFVNAAIEGTELLVRVESTETAVWVFEGQVLVSNAVGSLRLLSGQGATAEAGKAPIRRLIIKSRDAVHWALYYPPIIDTKRLKMATDPGTKVIQDALARYRANELPDAIAALDTLPVTERDTQFYTLRAGLLLSVGGVDEARADIARALKLNPDDGIAHALQSIIALAQNENDKALELAQRAATLEPRSPVPQIALSYAYQALFDIKKARKSVKKAIGLEPNDALAWARLSELELSLGQLDRALAAARRAVELDPDLERTQTVLGFARLTQIEISGAKKAFRKAITLDSAAPLPRLGLGLATIRRGDLRDGTREIEIAASLDPDNSLIRSYLGKAYYEEKRIELASAEFARAKELDPNDPTPYFYNAILKQTINRPVEALRDFQKAIRLNDNRAVYRSRLLLDEDLASRTANVARIYDDLGFQQRALLEGWRSVNEDPANHSAHRFLADSYRVLPRHEVARASELLQSQLLQPINITPVQPQQLVSNPLVLEGTGPGNPSFTEFNPLFTRNRLALQASGTLGTEDTLGNELIQSGLWNWFSYSLGQYHFQTDGFRDNNELKRDIYTVYLQGQLSPKHDVQAEFRRNTLDAGDTTLRIRPDDFSPDFDRNVRDTVFRAGYHFSPSVHSDIITSFIYKDSNDSFEEKFTQSFLGSQLITELNQYLDTDAYTGEAQYLLKTRRANLTVGGGYYRTENSLDNTSTFIFNGQAFPESPVNQKFNIQDYNAYLYSQVNYPSSVTWTLGFSVDLYDDARTSKFDEDQFNPKLGVLWNITSSTTLRAAGFRLLKQPLAVNQTIQPTQVAGFNQFFDDFNGSDVHRYGVGIDHKFNPALLGGFEFSRRDLDVPTQVITTTRELEFFHQDRDEDLYRAYLYWTPTTRLALSTEYYYEDLSRDTDDPIINVSNPKSIRTHRLPLGFNYFDPSGFFLGLNASYVDQSVRFPNNTGGSDNFGDNFWLVDAGIGYRAAKRWGIATLTVKNLFDEDFRYQNTDVAGNPRLPLFRPERLVLLNVSLSF